MLSPLPLLRPSWPAPHGVDAAMSLRPGGISTGPWAGLNISFSVGDDPAAVADNRAHLAAALGVRLVWPRLEHGVQVLRLRVDTPDIAPQAADVLWTTERGLACVATAADCLPVLLASSDGAAVAAVHAGWRGLSAGVLEAAVQALCEDGVRESAQLQAWLGPCIGPHHFEVGEDVLRAFGQSPDAVGLPRFQPRAGVDGRPRWLADLPGLATDRLLAAGVLRVYGSDCACTVQDPSLFFSFRRDGITGRMAAAIWRL